MRFVSRIPLQRLHSLVSFEPIDFWCVEGLSEIMTSHKKKLSSPFLPFILSLKKILWGIKNGQIVNTFRLLHFIKKKHFPVLACAVLNLIFHVCKNYSLKGRDRDRDRDMFALKEGMWATGQGGMISGEGRLQKYHKNTTIYIYILFTIRLFSIFVGTFRFWLDISYITAYFQEEATSSC